MSRLDCFLDRHHGFILPIICMIILWIATAHADTTSTAQETAGLTCLGITKVDTFSFGVLDSGQNAMDQITVSGGRISIKVQRHRDMPQPDNRPIQLHAGIIPGDSTSVAVYGYDRPGKADGWVIKYSKKIGGHKDLRDASEDVFLNATYKDWMAAIGVLRSNCGQTH